MSQLVHAGVIGASVLLAVAAIRPAIAGDPDGGPLKLRVEGGAATWEAHPDATGYRVHGKINYGPGGDHCAPDRLRINGQVVSFDDKLPAGDVRFALPEPDDERLTFIKDMQFTIEALEASGVLETDGFAMVADPFCTDEEVAAQIAAAGTGIGGGKSADGTIAVATALAGIGIAGIGAALYLRRKAV